MSQKYVNYNADTGAIIGFYTDDIHDKIPSPSIAITDKQWQDCLVNQGLRKVDLVTKKVITCERPLPSKDEALTTIRAMRDSLLTSCDWTQMPDSPLSESKKSEWKIYRQYLRDMPETCDVYKPVWPVQPN